MLAELHWKKLVKPHGRWLVAIESQRPPGAILLDMIRKGNTPLTTIELGQAHWAYKGSLKTQIYHGDSSTTEEVTSVDGIWIAGSEIRRSQGNDKEHVHVRHGELLAAELSITAEVLIYMANAFIQECRFRAHNCRQLSSPNRYAPVPTQSHPSIYPSYHRNRSSQSPTCAAESTSTTHPAHP